MVADPDPTPTENAFQDSDTQPIPIDGSMMEGGGQILRYTTALSCLLRKPIHVTNIRANRSKPGLRPQHLAGILMLRDLSEADLTGGKVDSQEISFRPSRLKSGVYSVDIGTAGSISLLIQIALPCLLFGGGESTISMTGGTNAPLAPQIDEFETVFLPVVTKHFGFTASISVLSRGYMPVGGGQVNLKVHPVGNKGLTPMVLTDRGKVVRVHGRVFVAGVLPMQIAKDIRSGILSVLQPYLSDKVVLNIELTQDTTARRGGNASGAILWAVTDTGCILGSSTLGEKRTKPKRSGVMVAESLIKQLEFGGCVDEHVQDQIIIFMALAAGTSHVVTGPLTSHTETAIKVMSDLSEARFETSALDDGRVEIVCRGIGLGCPPRDY